MVVYTILYIAHIRMVLIHILSMILLTHLFGQNEQKTAKGTARTTQMICI